MDQVCDRERSPDLEGVGAGCDGRWTARLIVERLVAQPNLEGDEHAQDELELVEAGAVLVEGGDELLVQLDLGGTR